MKDATVLRRVYQTYLDLHLRRSRIVGVVGMMFVTALLEMSGLSAVYPLVLALGNGAAPITRPIGLFAGWLPTAYQNQVILLLVGVAILYVVKNITLYYTYRHNIDFAMYFYRSLTRGLYQAYIQKPVLEFRRDSPGVIANMICSQTTKLIDGVVRPLLVVSTEALMLLMIGIVVFFVSPFLMTAVALTCGGGGAFYYSRLRSRAQSWGRERMDAASTLQELVNQTSGGIAEIKAFGREQYLTNRVSEAAAIESNMFRNLEMYQQGPRFLVESIFMVTFAVVYGVLLAKGEDASKLLAEFSLIAAASFRILPCLNRLVNSYSTFSFNSGAALQLLDRMTELHLTVHEQPLSTEQEAQRVDGFGKTISVRSVRFAFPGRIHPVLSDVNLEIAQGARIGIIGKSGSGKSTLLELLAGLYEPESGAVFVDGVSIYADLPRWHRYLGYVPQVPFIMPGTIRDNVTFGAPHTDDQLIWDCLKVVGLNDFVRDQSAQLNTKLGERGTGLSGGQKQLICLARAIYRAPAIILLDEPTSALDPSSEEAVIQAIESLPSHTSVVMVSHNIDALRFADKVYLCADGRVATIENKDDAKATVS